MLLLIIVELLIGQAKFTFWQRYVAILDRYFEERMNAKVHLNQNVTSMTRVEVDLSRLPERSADSPTATTGDLSSIVPVCSSHLPTEITN